MQNRQWGNDAVLQVSKTRGMPLFTRSGHMLRYRPSLLRVSFIGRSVRHTSVGVAAPSALPNALLDATWRSQILERRLRRRCDSLTGNEPVLSSSCCSAAVSRRADLLGIPLTIRLGTWPARAASLTAPWCRRTGPTRRHRAVSRRLIRRVIGASQIRQRYGTFDRTYLRTDCTCVPVRYCVPAYIPATTRQVVKSASGLTVA